MVRSTIQNETLQVKSTALNFVRCTKFNDARFANKISLRTLNIQMVKLKYTGMTQLDSMNHQTLVAVPELYAVI
jgi:hypothetical protein